MRFHAQTLLAYAVVALAVLSTFPAPAYAASPERSGLAALNKPTAAAAANAAKNPAPVSHSTEAAVHGTNDDDGDNDDPGAASRAHYAAAVAASQPAPRLTVVPPHVLALADCDLQRSALARHIIETELLPEVTASGYAWPAACPFNPALDALAPFRSERKRHASGTHYCKLCSRHFQSAWHLERHFLRAHAAFVPATARVCLADHCDLLDCAGLAASDPDLAAGLTTAPSTARTRASAAATEKAAAAAARAAQAATETGYEPDAETAAVLALAARPSAGLVRPRETAFAATRGPYEPGHCGDFSPAYCLRVVDLCFPAAASADATRLNLIFSQQLCAQHRCAAAAAAAASPHGHSSTAAGAAGATAPWWDMGLSALLTPSRWHAAADDADLASGLYQVRCATT